MAVLSPLLALLCFSLVPWLEGRVALPPGWVPGGQQYNPVAGKVNTESQQWTPVNITGALKTVMVQSPSLMADSFPLGLQGIWRWEGSADPATGGVMRTDTKKHSAGFPVLFLALRDTFPYQLGYSYKNLRACGRKGVIVSSPFVWTSWGTKKYTWEEQTKTNTHITPCPTYLNPECHFTVRWEFFENSLPENTFWTLKPEITRR